MVETQSRSESRGPRTTAAALTVMALLVGAALPVPSAADDRSLVKSSESEPYVMIMLDTTGSMNRVPGGEDPQYATLCQDDPGSKMYQAKQALYNVVGEPDLAGVHFGFATFPNQQELRVDDKDCNPDNSGNNGLCICELDTAVQNNGCSGWEPNFSTASLPDDDVWNGMRLRYPTTYNPNDSAYPAVMDYGDIIPLDWDSTNDKNVTWNSDNRRLIQRRLAPNLNLDGDNDGIPAYNDPDDPEAVPDFGVNSYFATSLNGDNVYPLLDGLARPLIARGSTPLARALRNFDSWFADWRQQAAANDPQFGCKQVHVIFITDGLDTCESGSGTPSNRETQPPAAAAEVCAVGENGECTGPRVWAVGYSITGTGEDVINNIAQSGGTNACPIVQGCSLIDPETGLPDPTCCPAADNPDHAFFPTTQDELVNAIKSILDEIRGGARSFAAAAVPQGQANVSDKTYLASFVPIEDNPLWPGSLDAYLRPLPLTTIEVILPDGTRENRQVPDRSDNCDPGEPSACRLWDAGDQLVQQTPTVDQLNDDPPDYNLGQGDAQRRVFYSVESVGGAVPGVRKPFVPSPIEDADAGALMELMGCGTIGSAFLDCDPTNPGDPTALPPVPSNRERLHRVVRWVHEPKTYVVPDPDPDLGDAIPTGGVKSYLLGEIFHADPVVVGGPENFRYYASDLFGDRPTRDLLGRVGSEAACGAEAPSTAKNPSFVCYFERHRLRRKVVLAGSNDGQLHAFDGGVFDGTFNDANGIVTGRFTNGTGRELFSYVPRAMMPMITDQSRGRIELYGVDGRVQFADVHIDVGAGPEWRTVAFGGMREGGAGYFALDMTQPDVLPAALDEGNVPEPVPSGLNNGRGYVPSCTNGGDGCGTLPYPSVLWEFYDLCTDPLGGTEPCDEDLVPGEATTGNGLPDLADGWSRPAIGIIQVCSSTTVPCPEENIVPRFVAIFGGGLLPSPGGSTVPQEAGNFLYMVDVETGKAIYKRQVEGAVPSEASAVDSDQDAVLDAIYVGTTTGLLYKVDMRSIPHLPAGGKITSAEWDPFPIFDVNLDDGGARPIFFPPSVIFVTEVGRFALAFGTGYREDLWADDRDNETGRFFVMLDQIVDDSSEPAVVRQFERSDAIGADAVLPFGPADLKEIDPEGDDREDNLLLRPELGDQPGWWMEFPAAEKVIAEPFALSGLLIFLTFQPEEVLGPSGDTCANTGQGRAFTVLTTSGNSIVPDDPRYVLVEELPTSPFAEKGVTKNPDDPSGGEVEQGIPDELINVYNELKKLLPRKCKFGSYSVNVKTRRSDTGIHFIAPVPMCFQQNNWQGL